MENITVTGILVGVIVASVEYRAEFLDPLIDDLRFTVVARNRYRAHIGR